MHSQSNTRSGKTLVTVIAAATAATVLLGAAPAMAYDYRPYFEWTGTPLKSTTQNKLFMAFGLRHGNDMCVPAFEAPITKDMVGQDMILSFGGALGTYVNQGCTKPHMLGYNLVKIIDNMKPVGLDFDIEGGNGHCDNLDVLTRAVRGVRRWRPRATIGVTIPAFEQGITTSSETPGQCNSAMVLDAFQKTGVKLDYINIMNMFLGTPDAQVTTDTYLTVIKASLDTIRARPGYADWSNSKLGVTFTNTGGNGNLTLARANDLVRVLPNDLAFVSMWAYKDVEIDNGASEAISSVFRSAAKTQFGRQPSKPMAYGTTWGFGSGDKLAFNFKDDKNCTVITNGGPAV